MADDEAHRQSKSLRSSLETEVQNAVNATGFGKFHYKLFVICAAIFMTSALGISSTGLIVPAAACDLKMSTVNKGRLAAAPMLGMVLGSYFWGCLAGIIGRKPALIATLFLDGGAGFLASLVPNFWIFTFLRFVNGFALTGEAALIFSYLGEFQPTRLRERILCWMEMAWAVGVIVLPLLGWAIIPLPLNYRANGFSFASWNLFVFICAMLPIFIGVNLLFFPESPKYLVEYGQEKRAIRVLSQMYAENTGNSADMYPVKCIDTIHHSNGVSAKKVSTTNGVTAVKKKKKSVLEFIREIYVHTMMILKPPYVRKTLITCTVQFLITSSYYTLMLWFPELFQRFAEFEVHHPGESASVCIVATIADSNGTVNEIQDYGCDTKIQTSVYTHTIFLGLSCVPTSILLPVLIGKLGYRFFLVFSSMLAGAATIGLFYVTSSIQNLILSCIFEALTSMGVSVVYCILVDFYPTHLRVMAAAFSAMCGRCGALFGNLMIGYLLDADCVVPIAVVAAQLIVAGILCCFLPGRDKIAADKLHQLL